MEMSIILHAEPAGGLPNEKCCQAMLTCRDKLHALLTPEQRFDSIKPFMMSSKNASSGQACSFRPAATPDRLHYNDHVPLRWRLQSRTRARPVTNVDIESMAIPVSSHLAYPIFSWSSMECNRQRCHAVFITAPCHQLADVSQPARGMLGRGMGYRSYNRKYRQRRDRYGSSRSPEAWLVDEALDGIIAAGRAVLSMGLPPSTSDL